MRKKHKPKTLKLRIPCNGQDNDHGRIIWESMDTYNNGQLYIGRVYTYHPTKGWRSRRCTEFKQNSTHTGIKGAFAS